MRFFKATVTTLPERFMLSAKGTAFLIRFLISQPMAGFRFGHATGAANTQRSTGSYWHVISRQARFASWA